MGDTYAVLTGDLIGSTQAGADAVKASMTVIVNTAREIGHWPKGKDTRFTRSRGDAWQLVIQEPADCLRAALMLQARLRAWPEGIPTRISIGIGRVHSLGTDSLADAEGPAFIASGQGLDQMGKSQRLVVFFGRLTPFLQSVASLADELARRWTREQAQAMGLALQPHDPTLEEMAPQLEISKQAVNYRLTGAGLRAIRLALRGWEDGFDMAFFDGAAL